MALPIVEKIAADILESINEITTGNGFEQTLTAVRATLTTYSTIKPEDLQVIIVQRTKVKLNEESLAITYDQEFELTCWVFNSDKVDTTHETRMNQVEADILKKLVQDRERDNNAMNTKVGEGVPFNDKNGSGITIPVVVQYRVKDTDPYTKT